MKILKTQGLYIPGFPSLMGLRWRIFRI